jgi:hypothetical protein
MRAIDVITVCYRRGVRLVITNGEIRARGAKGAVNEVLREGLIQHKQAIIENLGDGEFPDETLPDEIFIPANVPNDEESIAVCIEGQCLTRRAA